MSDPVPVRVPIQVRWRDLDALSHVNNAVYLTYFELARLGYIRALLGDDAEIDPQTLLPVAFQFILAEVTCHYRSPATLRDRLAVTIWVSRVGRKSFVFEYRITDEVTGQLIAEGCSTQV
jgi:acyl-CoA thioester hydrolase